MEHIAADGDLDTGDLDSSHASSLQCAVTLEEYARATSSQRGDIFSARQRHHMSLCVRSEEEDVEELRQERLRGYREVSQAVPRRPRNRKRRLLLPPGYRSHCKKILKYFTMWY